MRTETIEIFKFNELSDKAKERARDWWRNVTANDTAWWDESCHSIEAFCDHFGVTLKDWEVGPYSPFHYSTNAENRHFRGVKLQDINRDAMPTGYCLDYSLWQAMHDEFKRTGNAKAAFDHALHEGFKSWREDMESQLEDDYIDETIEANDYEFTKDGIIH